MNERQKNASIEAILDQGLLRPVTAGRHAYNMLRELGLRFIFWDTGYGLFFAALSLGLASALFIWAPAEYGASAAVAIAPLLLLFAVSFAETAERFGDLYEIKQTCRYTIRQIAALRMMAYSAAGTVFTVPIAYVGTRGEFGFLSLFSLCLASLFACSALSISLLHRTRNGWVPASLTALWLLGNLALMFAAGGKWEHLLRSVPAVAALALAAVCAALFAWQLSNMLREVKSYVIA